MNAPAALPLASWQNFYVIAGSAAGALTGLQFVVITLVMQVRTGGNMRDIHAFGTPTVIQFCTALFISVLMCAPWGSTQAFAICLTICGVAGVVYSFRVLWHARNATYQPDLADWIWYTVLPLAAYLLLLTAAILIWWNANWSLALFAADTLLFLLLGIHNSWDAITYLAVRHSKKSGTSEDKS